MPQHDAYRSGLVSFLSAMAARVALHSMFASSSLAPLAPGSYGMTLRPRLRQPGRGESNTARTGKGRSCFVAPPSLCERGGLRT